MSDEVPLEGSLGERLGLKLYELAASNSASHALLERNCRLILDVLTSDPDRVFEKVRIVTVGADGAICAVGLRDDLGLLFTAPADELSVGHNFPPNAPICH